MTVERANQLNAEERQKAKWESMNMGIEKWKRYLYPFGDITAEQKDPAADREA